MDLKGRGRGDNRNAQYIPLPNLLECIPRTAGGSVIAAIAKRSPGKNFQNIFFYFNFQITSVNSFCFFYEMAIFLSYSRSEVQD